MHRGAFSLDGQRLFCCGPSGLVVWESDETTARTMWDRAQLRNRVEQAQASLLATHGTPEQALRALASPGELPDEVRPQVRENLRLLVADRAISILFQEHLFLADVLTALEEDVDLSEELRVLARVRARLFPALDASELNTKAWAIVNPDGTRKGDAAYAVRVARAAVELREAWAPYQDTLAWALFANKEYAEAVARSEHALELAPESEKRSYQGLLSRLRSMIP